MIEILYRLSLNKFRSSFHLKKKDIDYINKNGFDTIKEHAYDFIKKRLSPLEIKNDGKQTPYRGHPVFVAQHAVACCCRGCLYKWHKVPINKELDQNEIDYIVDLIMSWLKIQYDLFTSSKR